MAEVTASRLRPGKLPSYGVGCSEDHHCLTGYFCDVPQFSCRPCLDCEQLNRHPHINITSCVTSVAACGPCFAGLVPGLVDNKCSSPSEDYQPLPFEWAVIAVSLIVAVIICAVAVYVLRNLHTLKIFFSTRTLIHSRPVDLEAAALQLPPSYDTAAVATANELQNDSEKVTLIKPIPAPPPQDADESIGGSRQIYSPLPTVADYNHTGF